MIKYDKVTNDFNIKFIFFDIKKFVEWIKGCQLKHSRVDRCMSKEQVAFKFHECPDGEEEDSRGNIVDI